jgi:FHA domain
VSDEGVPSSTLPERHESAVSGVAPLKAHFFVVMEADRPAAGGARYGLEGVDEVLIGRGEERGAVRDTAGGRRRLVVRVPGQWMSSTHARLVRTGDGWTVEDAGSKNGTFVGAVRITRAHLPEGDLLQ